MSGARGGREQRTDREIFYCASYTQRLAFLFSNPPFFPLPPSLPRLSQDGSYVSKLKKEYRRTPPLTKVRWEGERVGGRKGNR